MTKRSYLLDPGKIVALAEPSAAISGDNAVRNLVSEWSGEARPVEVALFAELASQVYSFPTRSQPGQAGSNSTFSPPIPAFFQIDYGCGSIVRRRIVDAQSARIFLGVCDNVRVQAARWLGSTAWTFITQWTLTVSASIGEAVGGSYDELQSTSLWEAVNGAAFSTNFYIPAGAYSWEPGVAAEGPGTPNVFWGSAQPAIFFASDVEEVVYRAADYQVVPPFRRFKCPYNGSMYIHTNGVAVGPTDLTLMVRWFLNS